MAFSKSKYTKRFNFQINRDSASHKAGANKVTIGTAPNDNHYSTGTTQITMTVKEAKALNSFLNEYLQPVATDKDLSSIS
jgi:hypothetical protein